MPLWPWQRRQPTKDLRDERVVAADAALQEWAAQLEAPTAGAAEAAGAAAAKGDHLVKSVQLLLAAPAGKDRDALIDGDLRRLLSLALLPGAEQDLEAHLALVREGFDNKDFHDALAGTLAALARDARLEQLTAAAEAGEGEDRFQRLAVACKQAMSLGDAEKRCEEVLQLRRAALHQAGPLLERPKRAASRRVSEASERRRLLQEQQAAVAERFHSLRMVPLEEEGLALERELQTLSDRQRELRMEIDTVSRQLDDARAKQRRAMTQADGWRLHLEEVKSSRTASQLELASEAEIVQMKRAGCTDLLDALQAMRAAASEALPAADAETEELVRSAEDGAAESAAGVRAETDVWLAEALAAVERWQAEDARAVQNLELMGVDGAERELPTRRELPALIAALRTALAEREALGDREPSRCPEAAAMLSELESLSGQPPAAAAPAAESERPRPLEPVPAAAGTSPSPRPAPISDFAMEVEESLTSPALGASTAGLLGASLGEAYRAGGYLDD